MRYPIRYQSQLLFRKSIKPNRALRFRPMKVRVTFRTVGFGVKPEIKSV